MNRRNRAEGGYTLAEILVVVVVIGLSAAVAVPAMGTFFRAYRVRSACDQLVGHLRAARQISVSQRLPVTFTIDSTGNTYSFTYTIPGKPATVESFELPSEVSVANTPSGALTYTLRQNGTVSNPTTPDDQSPAANYVTLSAPINGTNTDIYTITVLSAGKIGAKHVRS